MLDRELNGESCALNHLNGSFHSLECIRQPRTSHVMLTVSPRTQHVNIQDEIRLAIYRIALGHDAG